METARKTRREKSLTALTRRFLINTINRLKKNKLRVRETDPFKKIKEGGGIWIRVHFRTKGNLMLAKNSLALAKQGYDLMDKKRNILIRELMDLIDEARTIQEEIDSRHLLMRMNVCKGRTSKTESAMLRCLHIQFRSKIRSRSRRAVLWERKSLMSNICLMPESQRIHLVRPVNRSIRREKHSAR